MLQLVSNEIGKIYDAEKLEQGIFEVVSTVMLWKFRDQNGNLWNTETAIDGTEEEAASIILGANQ
jgi:hypothetical protein